MDINTYIIELLYKFSGIAGFVFVGLVFLQIILFCVFPTSKFARGLRNKYFTKSFLGYKFPLYSSDPNKEPKEESDESDNEISQEVHLKGISVIENHRETGLQNGRVRRRILQDEETLCTDSIAYYNGRPANTFNNPLEDISIQCHFTCEYFNSFTLEDQQPTARYVWKLIDSEPEIRRHAMHNLYGYLLFECWKTRPLSPELVENAASYFEIVLGENPFNMNALGNLIVCKRKYNFQPKFEQLENYDSASKNDNSQAEAAVEIAIALSLLRQHVRDDREIPIKLYENALTQGRNCDILLLIDWKFSLGWYLFRLDCFILEKEPNNDEYFQKAEKYLSSIISFDSEKFNKMKRKSLNKLQARSWALLGVFISLKKNRKLTILKISSKKDPIECFMNANRLMRYYGELDSFVSDRVAHCFLSDDLDVSIQHFTELLESNTEKAYRYWYLRCRGIAYSNSYKDTKDDNKYDSAVKDLEASYALMECSHETCYYLADIYHEHAYKEKAKEWCQKALAIKGGKQDPRVYELCAKVCSSLNQSVEANEHQLRVHELRNNKQQTDMNDLQSNKDNRQYGQLSNKDKLHCEQHSDITIGDLSVVPEPHIFDIVARNIKDVHWQSLALQLRLSIPDTECINNDYGSNEYRKKLATLDKWKLKFGDKATLGKLKLALKIVGYPDLI